MKVLVATDETQGQRKSDYHNAETGELVRFIMECDGEKVDGKCGCRRALGGMVSQKGTTTFTVEDRPGFELDDLILAVAESLGNAGWLSGDVEDALEWATTDAQELARLAEVFPVGSIVEKRGRDIKERRRVSV